MKNEAGKKSIEEFLSLQDSVAVTIRVSSGGGGLSFAPEPGVSNHNRVTCQSNGDMTVKLEKRKGYKQEIILITEGSGLSFQSFCAGKSGSRRCVTSGQIPGTPLTVQMLNTPAGADYSGIKLIDQYTDSSSLGDFQFTIKYSIQDGEELEYDPQIRNQGIIPPVTTDSRAPRRLDHRHPALAQIPLDDKAPPPEDSIAWRLWSACKDVAQEALESDYIQGIKNGALDPNQYGQYTVQDAVYCYHAQRDYEVVEERAGAIGEPYLAAFAQARRDSYRRYNRQTFADWHIADPSAVALSPAAEGYVKFERRTAHEAPPIYSVVSMIPCNQLWSWLATELSDAATATNLYSFWIRENNDWGGAYRLDNFIDRWFAANPEVFDWDRALHTYRSCVIGELNFFRSACGQDPVPMP